MNKIKEIIDAIMRVALGHQTVDSAIDWKDAHMKANASRAEVDRIIKESENPHLDKHA